MPEETKYVYIFKPDYYFHYGCDDTEYDPTVFRYVLVRKNSKSITVMLEGKEKVIKNNSAEIFFTTADAKKRVIEYTQKRLQKISEFKKSMEDYLEKDVCWCRVENPDSFILPASGDLKV